MLSAKGLEFSRGGRRILAGVDLALGAREARVLVGASGSGKTTLLRLIAGLEVPDRGRVVLDGVVASEAGVIRVPPHRRGVAMVFQDGALWSHMSVEAHLRFGLDARVPQRKARDLAVEESLELAGLSDRRRERPGHLSGGERQRLGLARALVHGPRLLLLDEPLAHVDLRARLDLARAVLRVIESRGITALWVTHRPDDVPLTNPAVSVLARGRIEDRSPGEVAVWFASLEKV